MTHQLYVIYERGANSKTFQDKWIITAIFRSRSDAERHRDWLDNGGDWTQLRIVNYEGRVWP